MTAPTPLRTSRRRPAGRRRAATLLALVGAAACDLPLGIPQWDTRWTLVLAADTLDADHLLPEGVRRGETGFIVDSLVTETRVLLDDVCEFCTCFSGPIPTVEITPFDWAVPLPGSVTGVAIQEGEAHIALVNDIPFDLLRGDEQRGEGHLQLLLVDRRTGSTLDSIRVARPFPPGDTLRAVFDLAGLTLHRDVVARVRGRIPGNDCESITLTPEMGIITVVELRDVVAPEVEVLIQDGQLNLPSRRVELPRVLVDRLRPGEARVVVLVEVENGVPVAVEGLLSVAARAQDLFGDGAALYTPLPVPRPPPGGSTAVRQAFLLDLERIRGATELHLATANRVDGNRQVLARGPESVAWRVTLHAEIPNR